ncbi:response regulator [Chitinivibrio alkaliphilus]|uniref:Response regulator receiver protein n=1 Tax=Chitinivibrio alkaliphilus ACht1 TaxID=1313304 RepID=U7D7J7_9BACT|nr:response regulator [Chitinivibrio alkaliphilus]ERP31903.1 response regulator receiver protein [Chitinivibrio alkaliphilus ACht1]
MTAKAKILLIDDEPDILDLLEIFLYDEYEVHTASNGFEGLSLLKDTSVDCIIVDLMMPVMDGIQFLSRVRSMDEAASIPVIVATSFNSATIQERSLRKIGFYEVLLKPLSRKLLKTTVREALLEHK